MFSSRLLYLGLLTLTCTLATTPQCPRGIMQFQHGKYEKTENASLILTPFGVDGRQLLSDPCNSASSTYTRYLQKEIFKVDLLSPLPWYNATRTAADSFLSLCTTEVRGLKRRIQQHPTPQSLRVRRRSPQSYVYRLQSPPNATHTNIKPYFRNGRSQINPHGQGKTGSKKRRGDPNVFESGCIVPEERIEERRFYVVVWSGDHGARRCWIFMFLSRVQKCSIHLYMFEDFRERVRVGAARASRL